MNRLRSPLWFLALSVLLPLLGCNSKSTHPMTAPSDLKTGPQMTAKVLTIDGDKMQLHVEINGKEQDVPFTKETKFLNVDGHELVNPKMEDLDRGFKGVTANIVTEKKDGKEIATRVQARRPG